MKLSIERAAGTIIAPPSKSALHRRLILNAIAGQFDAVNDPCADVAATVSALRALRDGTPVDCKESGSTLRFLLPVSLLFGGGTFTGSDRLSARPILPLIEALKSHGARIVSDTLPLTVSGALQPGDFLLSGDVSSQFFSGLLLSLPFLPGDSTLRWTTPLASAGYVRLTERMLCEHGVTVIPIENGYQIPGRQKPKPLPVTVEGDWSSAAAMLILGAISGSVTVTGLDPNSVQPDRIVLDVLRQCGAHVAVDADSVTVSKGRLLSFKQNGDAAPDLVPVLCALACACEGDSVLYRLRRLCDKESDRFDALVKLLTALGADVETERGETILIHGHGVLDGNAADVPPDHRMVMAAALMSAVSTRPVTVGHADSLDKSYPDFLSDFKTLGGHVDAI